MDAFHQAMQRHDLVALWERSEARANAEIQSEPAFHWRWSDIEPTFDQAVAATDMTVAERRVVQLKNPAFPADYVAATTNICLGYQILMPGESARAHRHNMNALRFVVEGAGAATIVDGKRCPMEVGDLILTPGMAWHEHEHSGTDSRVVWLDALDAPLFRHLRCVHFEPGLERQQPKLPPDSAFSVSGFVPAGVGEPGHSPIFRYTWADAVAAIEATPAAADGARTVRYTNPATGGAVMELIDCYLVGLEAGAPTAPRRTTANAACLVVEGSGASSIGDRTVRWGKYDVFTIPAMQWATHSALAAGAKLFLVTDREVLRRLGMLQEEEQPTL